MISIYFSLILNKIQSFIKNIFLALRTLTKKHFLMKKYLLLLVLLTSGLLSAQSIKLHFEDAYTFQRITNAYVLVEQSNQKSQLYKADQYGRFFIKTGFGKIHLSFYAENYEAIETDFELTEDVNHIDVKVILSQLNYQLPTENAQTSSLIDVRFFDKETGAPIDATLHLNENNFSLQSHQARLNIKKTDFDNFLMLKAGDSLSFTAKAQGYKTYTEKYRLSKALEHKAVFLEAQNITPLQQSTPIDNHSLINTIKNAVNSLTTLQRSANCTNFPTTIKVGLSCSCNSCSSVSVMTILNYVKKGLNDEWLSSWEQASLESGTLPYKSYGAYYTLHPINPNYDISNTTCKQVWDSDYATSCVNAAIATDGYFLVTASDNIARSEYSAENNGQGAPAGEGCGDGYSGTGSSWPCISDNVCAGHARYGHGRGMCQWGTQRWAQQYQSYEWIADHYYNPGYIYRCNASHPHPDLVGNNPTIDVNTIAPGHVVNVTISVQNITQPPSDRTRIGFYLSTDQVFDANDRLLNYVYINPLNGFASQNISKALTIPVTTTDGNYYVLFVEDYQELLVENDESNNLQSLALTVDSNAVINNNFITQNISIYPNPTKGKIAIKIAENIEISSIEIYNILGQKIMNATLHNGQINIGNLAKGSYLIKITDIHNNAGTFKIVKR
jgi:hypothetical protein